MRTSYQRARGPSNAIKPPTVRDIAESARPPGAPAQRDPYKTDFNKVTRAQQRIPIPKGIQRAKGESGRRRQPRDEHTLTSQEQRLLIAMEQWGFDGADCSVSNLKLGECLGQSGSPRTIKRVVRFLLHGRPGPNGWRGLIDRGWVEIVPDPKDPNRRVLRRTAKWTQRGLSHDGQAGAPTPPAGDVEPPAPPASYPAGDAAPSAIAAAELVAHDLAGAELVHIEPVVIDQAGAEVLARVLPPTVHSEPWPVKARVLVELLRSRHWRFELRADGSVGYGCPGWALQLTADELEALKRLKPWIVALLNREQAEAARQAEAPNGKPAAAQPVRNAAEIRSMIGRLTIGPPGDDSDCQALGRVLVDAFNDADPALSLETYTGLARDVKRGELPEAVLQAAFEEACRRNAEHRGKSFIAAVQRRIAEAHRGQPAG